jgi:hypothetical protein
MLITGIGLLFMVAKKGPTSLFCISRETNCVLLVSVLSNIRVSFDQRLSNIRVMRRLVCYLHRCHRAIFTVMVGARLRLTLVAHTSIHAFRCGCLMLRCVLLSSVLHSNLHRLQRLSGDFNVDHNGRHGGRCVA